MLARISAGAVVLLWLALQPASAVDQPWVGPGLGEAAASPSAVPVEHHVHIVNQAFDPVEHIVQAGDTVVWDNHDILEHTVTDITCIDGGACAFASVLLQRDDTFTFTFDAPAAFDYFCTTHGFAGLIVVDDPLREPDLVVSALVVTDVQPTPLAPLPKKEIVATIENVGDETGLTSTVDILYRVGDEERLIKSQMLNAFHPGETESIIARWTTTGHVGDFPVIVRADVGDSVPESNEENNEATEVVALITPPGALPGMDLLPD